MPNRVTVLRWLRVHDEFRDQYAQAREVQADTIVDEILEIADDARNGWMERQGDDGAGLLVNSEYIQRARLRIDARKWMAGGSSRRNAATRSKPSSPGPMAAYPGDSGETDYRQARRHPTGHYLTLPKIACNACTAAASGIHA